MSSLPALFDPETPAAQGRCSVPQGDKFRSGCSLYRSLDAFSLLIFSLLYLHHMPFAQIPTLYLADEPSQAIAEVVAKAVSVGEETEGVTGRRCSPADTSRNKISLHLQHVFPMFILKSKSRPEVGKQQTKLGIKNPVTINSRPAGQERETREQAIPMIISKPEAGWQQLLDPGKENVQNSLSRPSYPHGDVVHLKTPITQL